MKTIKNEWEKLMQTCVPTDAGDAQKTDMENVYYCGAYAVINILIDKEDGLPNTDELKKRFMHLYDEINAYTHSFTSHTDSS